MYLNDIELTRAQVKFDSIISPFKRYDDMNRQEKPSSGLSCCGYDMTLGNEFKWFKNPKNDVDPSPIDPRNPPSPDCYQSVTIADGDCSFAIQPRSFLLACTKEYVKIPDTMVAFLMDKSSLARLGLFLFNTVFEPGWEGQPTLEIANFNTRPIILHPGMGICQFMFSTINKPIKDYLEKSGKYSKQVGVTTAR